MLRQILEGGPQKKSHGRRISAAADQAAPEQRADQPGKNRQPGRSAAAVQTAEIVQNAQEKFSLDGMRPAVFCAKQKSKRMSKNIC